MTDSVYYWPHAVTEDGEKLFTYDSLFTLGKALEQFSIWQDHYKYKIKEAWIDTTDGKRISVVNTWAVDEITEIKPPTKAENNQFQWQVLMVGRGLGAQIEYYVDYDEALRNAHTAKEDWESVSVYERTENGWHKCFDI